MAKHTYTVEAGRQIYRDGKPWLYISGSIGYNGAFNYMPVEADALVHLVVDVLNSGYEFDDKNFRWVKRGNHDRDT